MLSGGNDEPTHPSVYIKEGVTVVISDTIIGTEGELTLNHSTVSGGNTASLNGGGIYLSSAEAFISFGSGWSGTVGRNKPDDIFHE